MALGSYFFGRHVHVEKNLRTPLTVSVASKGRRDIESTIHEINESDLSLLSLQRDVSSSISGRSDFRLKYDILLVTVRIRIDHEQERIIPFLSLSVNLSGLHEEKGIVF